MQRYWYEKARRHGAVTYRDKDVEFIIYKGIKLEKTNDGLRMLDVRFNDFYTRVSKRDKRVLKKHGFIKGCDILMYNRDLMRSSMYKREIEDLYTQLDRHRKLVGTRSTKVAIKKRSRKAIGILERNIRDTIDLFLLYSSRANQFEIKYNGKVKD